jgi:hypothetical protein
MRFAQPDSCRRMLPKGGSTGQQFQVWRGVGLVICVELLDGAMGGLGHLLIRGSKCSLSGSKADDTYLK